MTVEFQGKTLKQGDKVTIRPAVTTSDLSGSITTVLDRWGNRDGVSDQFGTFTGDLKLDWINGAHVINCNYNFDYEYRQDCREHDIKYLKEIKIIPFSRVSQLLYP